MLPLGQIPQIQEIKIFEHGFFFYSLQKLRQDLRN